MKIKNIYIIVFSLLVLFSSCEDNYLDRTTETNVSDVVVYNSLEGLQGILHGVYRKMYSNDVDSPGFQGMPGKLFMYDLRCEDIVPTRGAAWLYMDYRLWYGGEKWSTTNQNWSFYYNIILNANHVLDNVGKFPDGEKKNFVEGQARALRAYANFYLIRLYQHSYAHIDPVTAPGIILQKTVTKEGQPRTTVQACYDFILEDLGIAETRLQDASTRDHKSMINYNVVCGILARVHLEMATPADLTAAANYASKAREGYPLMSTDEYQGFNDLDNKEWIWGLHVQKDQADSYQTLYNLITDNVNGESYSIYSYYFTMDKLLQDKIPANDIRNLYVNDANVPEFGNKQVKFQGLPDHVSSHTLMRSSEMLLIEAECKARTNDESGAKTLLKELRDARLTTGVSTLSANSGQNLLDEIALERRIELWGEGFRFFDLKRLNKPMLRDGNNTNSYWYDVIGLQSDMYYLTVGEPMWNMQIPLKEFEGNDALDHEKDQNPAPRL